MAALEEMLKQEEDKMKALNTGVDELKRKNEEQEKRRKAALEDAGLSTQELSDAFG